MTSSRLKDVYFLINGRWVFQLRTFHPFSASEQKLKGNTSKNIPCRQRAYFGKDSKNLIHDAAECGFSSGYWRLVKNLLMRGL